VSKKPKNSKIKKNQANIELTLGQEDPSKYDIMKAIAQKYSIYGSTVWLNTPIPSEGQKTPAELMLEGKTKLVYELIQKSDGKFDL
jgi:hypothetical protein